MHQFRLWAPYARSVELKLASGSIAMTEADGGWWSASAETSVPSRDSEGAVVEYGYSLDGEEATLPDPRSPWQPHGIHGLSALVDHSTFQWTDQHWQARPLPSAVIYELHIGTFTPEGTFDSAIEKFDYLVDLGITHIELMPVSEFSGRWGWGYDGVDLFAPHHAYGGPEGLKRLVNTAHAKGLAVILDVVYNHLGPAGNYLSRFGPYFTQRHRTPWGEAVNLDGPQSHEVRRFLCDNALMWLRDYHFDGLRVDAVHAIVDTSAVHFLEALAEKVDRLGFELGRHRVLIAESDLNDPRIVRSPETGGYGFYAQWSDDFHHALHTVLTRESTSYYADFGTMGQLAKCLKHVFAFDGVWSSYRKRLHGRPIELLPGYKFLGYIQNHDQVGNRAAGERISHLVSHRRAKMAAGIVLTAPFIPMLFQGEEWAASSPFQYFTQHEDEELGRAVSEGRRSEFSDFGWDPQQVPDPQDPRTFQRSKLRWDETHAGDHADMLDWYRRLIRLRRTHRDLTDGNLQDLQVRFSEEEQWLVIERCSLTIACNFASATQCLPVRSDAEVALSSANEAQVNECGVRLGGETFAVLKSSQE
jgi:maltooligosyltrehalose trehalohydrolase